jgi:PAS domain-containing protein
MKDDPFLGESPIFQEPKSRYGQMWPPAIALVLVVLTDTFLIPWVTITPLACTIMICLMALRYPQKLVVFWALVFICTSCVVLSHEVKLVKTVQIPEWTVVLRTIGSSVTGCMAIAISIYRGSLNRSYQQVITVLEKMPVPIIVSDESGTITFINDQASELLGVSIQEAPGHSYFSFLANQSSKGQSIQRYLQIFDSDDDKGLKLRINLRRHPNKLMSGTLMGLGRGNQRRIVTVIREGPEVRKGSTMPFLR